MLRYSQEDEGVSSGAFGVTSDLVSFDRSEIKNSTIIANEVGTEPIVSEGDDDKTRTCTDPPEQNSSS